MPGRFEIHSLSEVIAETFRVTGANVRFDIQANYNIAPSQEIPIVIQLEERQIVPARWGFVPAWSKDLATGYKMINARAESVAEKPSFKKAFQDQRCLVIADGFYEWKQAGKEKRPMYLRQKSGQPFGFAGLFSIWTSPEGKQIRTCTIITTDANELVNPVHDRMPVILPEDKYDLWLDPNVHDPALLQPLLQPCDSDLLELYEVSPKVNSPRNNHAENIKPVKD